MLVQISPWQTTKTSMDALPKKRKSTSTKTTSDTLVTASFVNGQQRSRQRKKNNDMIPLVVVTSSHKATLVGYMDSNWQESTMSQYSTRPGPAFSLLTTATPIAAVMDGRKERLYGFQNNNHRLISWRAEEEQPSEHDESYALASAAMCLHARYGFVYGTCADGTSFVGQWVRNYTTKTEEFTVKMLESQVSKDMVHVHTLLTETGTNVGSKRKASELSDGCFCLYQVFCSADEILVVKTNINLHANKLEEADRYMGLIKTNLVIDTKHILASSLDDLTLALVIQMASKDNGTPQFRALCLSLENLRIGTSIDLPSTTRHVGGLSSSLLAIGTVDQIRIYDAIHGSLVKVEEMSDIVSDTKHWQLFTDPKRNRLVVVSQQSGSVHVSLATLENVEEEFSLATALQSVSPVDDHQDVAMNLLQMLESSTSTLDDRSTTLQALSALQACIDHIMDPANVEIKPNFFMDAYECALAMFVSPSAQAKDPLAKNGTNGVHIPFLHKTTRGETPSSTPLEFIDGAISIIIRVLQLPKIESRVVGIRIMLARLDARAIFVKLIRTGKVSARVHFHDFLALLRSIKLSNKKGVRVASPVDVMHELLSSCSDLTENNLVTMIHYILCRALPEDIAENFMDWTRLGASHPYTVTSKAYFKERSTVRKLLMLNGASMNSPTMKEAQFQVATLSNKLLSMGSAFLIDRVVKYSECNEALLRTALHHGLPLADEPALLSRFLTETLRNAPSRASCKWLIALCEGCRERLKDAEGAASYESILVQVKSILHHGEIILNLSSHLGEPSRNRSGSVDLAKKPNVLPNAMSKRARNKDEQIPDYCVEHLLF